MQFVEYTPESVKPLISGDDEDHRIVNIHTSDGEQFQVKAGVIRLCDTIATMLEDEQDEDTDIVLPCVDSDCMRMVIEFCNHCVCVDPMHAIPVPLTSFNLFELVQPWYAEFAFRYWRNRSGQFWDRWFEVSLMLNYLSIRPLLLLHCVVLARVLPNKTPEELESILHVTLGEEDRASIIKNQRWTSQELLDSEARERDIF